MKQRIATQLTELTKVTTTYYQSFSEPLVKMMVARLRQQPTNVGYYFNGKIDKYLGVGDWQGNQLRGVLVMGPFLANTDWTTFDSLDWEQRSRQLSRRVPILSEAEIQNAAAIMLELLQQTTDLVRVITETDVQPYVVETQREPTMDDETIVNARFKDHHAMMAAIARGDDQNVDALMDETQPAAFFMPFTGRVPNRPLRAAKNIGFVHSTMGRIGAERGGVRPIYLHLVSEKYAIKIEQAHSLGEIWQLIKTMDHEYCQLVQAYGDHNYGREVNDAINYVRLRFAQPLTLATVAAAINVDPYRLSRQFKRETGQSLFAFIKEQRINYAQDLLRRGHLTVSEVAIEVGFNDQGYFGKCFKAVTGKTPTAYSQGVGNKPVGD